jgi:hypothetical protein
MDRNVARGEQRQAIQTVAMDIRDRFSSSVSEHLDDATDAFPFTRMIRL